MDALGTAGAGPAERAILVSTCDLADVGQMGVLAADTDAVCLRVVHVHHYNHNPLPCQHFVVRKFGDELPRVHRLP